MDFINGTHPNSRNPEVRLNRAGHYTVTLTVDNVIGSDSITHSVFLNAIHGQKVRLELNTDIYGHETTWDLKDPHDRILFSGGPYDASLQYVIDFCLLPETYTFTIYDAFNDGICCNHGIGTYTITHLATGDQIHTGGTFGDTETVAFTVSDPNSVDAYVDCHGICYDNTPCYSTIHQCTTALQAGQSF